MTCNFRVGQKVVYLGGEHHPEDIYPDPVVGGVYTVSNSYVADDGSGAVMIELHEHPTVWESDEWYAGFDALFFRPVAERKSDISLFKSMLKPSKEQVAS